MSHSLSKPQPPGTGVTAFFVQGPLLMSWPQADIFESDFHEATVATLYLLPELNVRLVPKLAKLKPGSGIISDDFDMKGPKPKEVVHLNSTPGEDTGESQNTL